MSKRVREAEEAEEAAAPPAQRPRVDPDPDPAPPVWPLLLLPTEMRGEIRRWLSRRDRAQLARVCRGLHDDDPGARVRVPERWLTLFNAHASAQNHAELWRCFAMYVDAGVADWPEFQTCPIVSASTWRVSPGRALVISVTLDWSPSFRRRDWLFLAATLPVDDAVPLVAVHMGRDREPTLAKFHQALLTPPPPPPPPPV